MLRLTLRTLLAYLDDTLPAAEAKVIGHKLSESKQAMELVDQIKKVIRKRGLSTPPSGTEGGPSDPNTVAAYLSDNLPADQVTEFEKLALESDVHLADVAACHQILTLLLSEQMRVPPTAYRRMYGLVKGKESIPGRTPGKVIPVGGVVPTDNPAEATDADAQFLLGMSPYSKSQPVAWKVGRWVAAALLAAGFVVTAWLAWPKGQPAVASLPPNGPATKPTATGPDSVPKANDPTTEKKPEPDKTPVEGPGKPAEPMPKSEDPPKKHLVPPAETPKPDRLSIGKFDSPDDRVLISRKADGDTWSRVAKGEAVFSSDKLFCPPGFTAKLAFETGAVAELWGNVFPDLLPLPLLDAAITPYVHPDGFDADFTLHTGRVYLSAGRATGANIRVRVRDEIWDLSVPDRASEVVVQVINMPTPGRVAETPKAVATAFVLKGTATAKVRTKSYPLATGEVIEWDSKGGKLAGPKKPEGPMADGATYFARSSVYPNAKTAQPMRKALDQFAERLKKAPSVNAAFAELRTEPMAPPTDDYHAGYRFAVLAAAGQGDFATLADSLNDANRPDGRAAAVFGIQHALSSYPELGPKFQAVATSKLRLSDDATEELLRTLRGVTDQERTDPDTLYKLTDQLNAPEIAQREAALYTLVTQVDPSAAMRSGLLFDTAASEDVRKAAKELWRKRIDELLKPAK